MYMALILLWQKLAIEGTASSGGAAAIDHTLQRHTEILADYRGEFSKTSATIAAKVEREKLLRSSVLQDLHQYRSKDGGRGHKMDSLQRELEHTRNSERMIDEQINIAMETRDNLVDQRKILKGIQTRLNDLSSKFPLINSLVNKINLRKRRDTIILGSVIGFCLVFMIWYVFGWQMLVMQCGFKLPVFVIFLRNCDLCLTIWIFYWHFQNSKRNGLLSGGSFGSTWYWRIYLQGDGQ